MDQELEKAREEIPEYKRWSEAAEEAKTKVLKELDSTKRLIEELNLNLQRAQQTKENQPKQDSELTIELVAIKELLESSHTFHLEAEEKRIGAAAALAREQDSLNREETQTLNRQVISVKDFTSKLNSASTLLLDLRNELDSYMELKSKEKLEEMETETKTHEEMQAAIALAKKELEEEKVSIEKAISKLNCLKVAAISLRSELETEKSALFTIRQTEGMASIAVSALESEVENTHVELALIRMKEKEAREKKSEFSKQLQLLAMEAEQTKLSVQTAREMMQKPKEEAEEAKAAARTIKSLLIAVQKETEASKASKRLALAAIEALKESAIQMDSPSRVTLSFEDYHELSRRACEAEEQANIRVSASFSQIKIAKESESKSLAKLEQVEREITARKEALKIANEKKAEKKAKEGKLGVEKEELRIWRAEQERTRKAIKSPTKKDSTKLDQAYFPAYHVVSPKPRLCGIISRMTTSLLELKMGKRNRKSFFPRILVFLAKKKQHSCYKSDYNPILPVSTFE